MTAATITSAVQLRYGREVSAPLVETSKGRFSAVRRTAKAPCVLWSIDIAALHGVADAPSRRNRGRGSARVSAS